MRPHFKIWVKFVCWYYLWKAVYHNITVTTSQTYVQFNWSWNALQVWHLQYKTKDKKGNRSTTADEDLPESERGHLKKLNKTSIIRFQKRAHYLVKPAASSPHAVFAIVLAWLWKAHCLSCHDWAVTTTIVSVAETNKDKWFVWLWLNTWVYMTMLCCNIITLEFK